MANGFKSSLFGFKKKDVIRYLEEIDIDYRDGLNRAESGSYELEKKNSELSSEIRSLTVRCGELEQEKESLLAQRDALLQEKEALASDMSELVLLNNNLEIKLQETEACAIREKQEISDKLAEATNLLANQGEKLSQYEKLIAEREVLVANAIGRAEDSENRLVLKTEEMNGLLQNEAEARREIEAENARLLSRLENIKAQLEAERQRPQKVQTEKKRKDAVSAILSYVRKR